MVSILELWDLLKSWINLNMKHKFYTLKFRYRSSSLLVTVKLLMPVNYSIVLIF